MTGQRSSRKRKSTILRLALIGLGIVVVVLGGISFFAYQQLSSARTDLDRATTQATTLQTALTNGDVPAAKAALTSLQDDVDSADSILDSTIFSVGTKVPFMGKNITAVRTVTSAVKHIADSGLPPLVEVADQFNAKTFNPRGGAVDVAAIEKIGPNIKQASTVLDAAAEQIATVDAGALLSAVQEPVREAQQKVADAATAAARADTASEIVPEMLTGTHDYLLLFQNNAEIRATGGLPGAWAVLQVRNGAISLGAQGNGASMGDLASDVTSISDEELDLFDTQLVRDFRNINFTPDFPRAAAIGAKVLKRERGIDVDGVISLDPVTLSYLLKGTGSIALSDSTVLTEKNAVDVLLNSVYVDYSDGLAQDAFFASATDKILARVLNGAGNPTEVLSALTRATNERRIAVWSSDKAIQDRLSGTQIAGELPTGKDARPAIGFYLNDATGAKMQYYLDYDIAAKATTCNSAGVQKYDTVMTLRSTAPADAADLPVAIKGPGFGAVPGTMLMNLYVYAPDGGKVTALTIDGKETTAFPGTHLGRGVTQVTVELAPGQTATVESTIASGKAQREDTRVLATPSIVPGSKSTTIKTAC
ncbi:DUF4012 domain-containing protein [Aeromicrobium sp. P5_D10]